MWKQFIRYTAFINCGLVIFCITSCNKPKEELNRKTTLYLNISEQPTSFDPRSVRRIKDLTLAKQLFEGLMRFDLNNQLTPALAKTVAISEDQCTYTFTLREAFWNNQDPITAYDFVKSYQTVLKPDFPCDYSHMLFPIKNAQAAKKGVLPLDKIGVQALDNKTLVIQLEEPIPYFLELTAFPTYFPVHPTLDINEKQLVSSGPYNLKNLEPEYSLTLEKNNNYWDREAVTLKNIYLSVIPDNNTEALLFEQGELDWLGQPLSHSITPGIMKKMREEGNLYSYSVAGTLWLTFNMDRFPLNHIALRKSLSAVISREQLVTHILQGGQRIATSVIPTTMQVNTALALIDGDALAGKRSLQGLYEELDIENLPPLTLSFQATPRNYTLAQAIQNQLESALSIKIILDPKEGHVQRKKVKEGDFEIAFGEWVADYNDPISFLELFLHPRKQGMNDANWQNPTYIALLESAAKEKESDKRLLLLQKAEEILMGEMPVIPLYHYAFDYAKNNRVKDVVLSPLGLADFKYAKVHE